MIDYKNVPLYLASQMRVVPEYLFGEAVSAVIAEGVDDEQAMRVVEAVLGPLRLVSPPPLDEDRSECPYLFFGYQGGWQVCRKEHGFEGEDPEFHYSNAGGNDRVEWHSDGAEDRVIKIEKQGDE